MREVHGHSSPDHRDVGGASDQGVGEGGAARGQPARPIRVRGMAEARRDELDAFDPGWRPVWGTGGQRCYRLVVPPPLCRAR